MDRLFGGWRGDWLKTNRMGYIDEQDGQVYLHSLDLKIPPAGFSRRPALFAGIKKISAAVTTEILK